MKQIDKLLLKSFVGPFLVAFGIALFVFLMQYLWVYIDEIIGKGAGLPLILELIAYLSVSLMPMALPVAILIASVMTMGNLAEHYELASMKSAGIPLLRVMMPLVLVSLLISTFSFVCSNYLIPVANLKARTRLYDIRKQKPSLSLEEGAFNDDFQGFAIRIGEKDDDNKLLKDVMLYKQGPNMRGKIEAITAKTGAMSVTPDERYFILELENGYQYQEPNSDKKESYPFVRTQFEKYRKTFDLGEFEIKETDESAFQNHHNMLSVQQLDVAIDSIHKVRSARKDRLSIEVGRFIFPLKRSDRAKQDSLDQIIRDSIKLEQDRALVERGDVSTKEEVTLPKAANDDIKESIINAKQRVSRMRDQITTSSKSELPAPKKIDSTAFNYVDYLAGRPNYKKSVYVDRSLQYIRSMKSYAEGAKRRLDAQKKSLVEHIYELHAKFSFALACFIFLFIGAPMGAIIRKGGFGYPILVSIIFFMIFIILNIMCKKLMASFSMDPVLAAWVPTLVIFPIGAILTYSAMNDIKFSLADRLGRSKLWQKIAKLFKKKEAAK